MRTFQRLIASASLLSLLGAGGGCAFVAQSIASKTHTSTPYDLVEGSPMYKLIPRGWIPAVKRPRFVDIADAADFMVEEEPVMVLEYEGLTRIYPTWYLDGHEVVNDTLEGDPIAITWCPLVQAGVVYRREAEGRALTLSASGRLWRDALVMYDRETGSHWTQHDGRALLGPSQGAQLERLPSTRMSWADARARYPEAEVLRKRSGLLGDGRATIYDGYLARTDQLGIFGTDLGDSELPGRNLVLGFERPESSYAIDLAGLAGTEGAAISVGGEPVFAHTLPGGEDARVWYRAQPGRSELLDLELVEGGWQLQGPEAARWDAATGAALSAGQDDLVGIPGQVVFWFAWKQNHPETRVWQPGPNDQPVQPEEPEEPAEPEESLTSIDTGR